MNRRRFRKKYKKKNSMKKPIFLILLFTPIILLFTPIILHAQLFVNLGAGGASFEQKVPLSDQGSHALPSNVLVAVVKMAAGFEIRNVVVEAELRPTITHMRNSPNNFGVKAGYHLKRFIPAIGYYYNYCNSDNPIYNKAGFGYSLQYISPIRQNADLCLDAAYLNNCYQFTVGFHIPF
jgi:hypothetical protein